jgi:hypothetical protein
MAAGDIKFFAQALHDLGNKIHDLDTDVLKLALITDSAFAGGTNHLTNSQVAAPHYGGTGTTNLATNAVATGTAWTAPVTLANKTWTLVSNAPIFRADNPATIAQDAGGFTNARWGVIYNDSTAAKQAIALVDLGSNRSLVSGSLAIDWNGATNDILSLSQA